MGQLPSVKKNFLWNFLCAGSNVVFPLLMFLYAARILKAESIGKVDFAVTFVNYFIMFASLGIPTYGIRECAAVRDNRHKLSKVVQELVLINVITTFFVSLIFLCTIFFVTRLNQELVLYLITGINLILNPFGINWLYSALEDYRYIAIRTILFKLCSLILVFVMIHSTGDYLFYAIINVISISGVNILNFLHSRKYVSYYKIQLEIKPHIKPILTFFTTSVAISFYANLDILMIGFWSGDAQVGYYSAALKIRATAATVVTILSTVLLPRLSYYAQNKKHKEFDCLLKKSFNYAVLTAMPLTLFFSICSSDSVILLAGAEFKNAGTVLLFLMPTVLFAGLSNVTGTQLLVPYGNENKLLISIIAGAVIDIILNTILIPKYAAKGAAVATSITELVVLLVQIIMSVKYIHCIVDCRTIASGVIASIISGVFLLLLNITPIENLSMQMSIKFILFMGCYLLLLILFANPFVMNILKERKI